MAFLLQQLKSDSPIMEQTSSLSTPTDSDTVLIQYAFELLELYLDTEESSPLMPLLKKIRNEMLEDLDQVGSVKEI